MEWLRETRGELELRVKAMPNAGASAVVGVRGGELVVRLGAQPEKGKANRELASLLAELLDIPRSSVRLVAGETARHKVVAVPVAARAGLERLVAAEGR